MASTEDVMKQFKEVYGKPPAGFDEFLQKRRFLKPFVDPTRDISYCYGYEVHPKLRLHDLMIQPFFESRTMTARPTDVIVNTPPKAGTTWMQEICYLIANNVDFAKAKSKILEERVPFIEIPAIGIKGIEKLSDPRVIKCHLAYEDLPQSFRQANTKIVFVLRNPKDVAVSYYHFIKMLGYFAYAGTLDDFVNLFVSDTPILFSTFHHHVMSFWERRNDKNVLIVFYEDLQKDLKGGVRQVADFMGVTLTAEQVNQIADHCSFSNMSTNPMTNYSHGGATVKAEDTQTQIFMRKGKVGDWKNHFTPDMDRKLDAYIAKHFHGTGLEFQYEI